jgi:hypothetical protein
MSFKRALFNVIHERCGPSETRFFASTSVVQFLPVDFTQQSAFSAERTEFRRSRLHFMVPDEDNLSITAIKSAHPVVFPRDEQAVIHALARFRKSMVGEARRQVQNSIEVRLESPRRRIVRRPAWRFENIFQTSKRHRDDCALLKETAPR